MVFVARLDHLSGPLPSHLFVSVVLCLCSLVKYNKRCVEHVKYVSSLLLQHSLYSVSGCGGSVVLCTQLRPALVILTQVCPDWPGSSTILLAVRFPYLVMVTYISCSWCVSTGFVCCSAAESQNLYGAQFVDNLRGPHQVSQNIQTGNVTHATNSYKFKYNRRVFILHHTKGWDGLNSYGMFVCFLYQLVSYDLKPDSLSCVAFSETCNHLRVSVIRHLYCCPVSSCAVFITFHLPSLCVKSLMQCLCCFIASFSYRLKILRKILEANSKC